VTTATVTVIDKPSVLPVRDHPQERVAYTPVGGAAYQFVQRLLDVIIAFALIVLLGPLMLLVGVLVRLTSRGPVVFKQQRAGLHGRPFTMYKFRSMHDGAEDVRSDISHLNMKDGPVFKIPDDPRLTRLGWFLRRSSIDELPQLFNVLAGQMSLVGPRPLWVPEARGAAGAARLRTTVKPGMTCLWQISGRSELSYDKWILLDLYYIRRRSTLLDLMIMVQTVPVVISGHGAY